MAFIIRCNKCGHKIFTNGTKPDLEEKGMLDREIKKSCKSCGGPRQFRCLNCGTATKMIRLIKR